MEALAWLKNNKNTSAFATNWFQDTETAIEFVQELYDNGAARVEVADADTDEEDYVEGEGHDSYADTFLLHLPEDKSKRLDLVPIVWASHPDELDGDWNDNEPIRLWWD